MRHNATDDGALAMATGRKNRRSLSALREPSCLLITCSFLCFPVTLARCKLRLSARWLPPLLHVSTIMLPYSSALSSRESGLPGVQNPTVHFSTWRTCEDMTALCDLAFNHMLEYLPQFQPTQYISGDMVKVHRVTHCRFRPHRSASARPN